MEDDGLCLHLSILDIHLVPTQHNGNVFTNPYQVSMPVGNILVSDPGRHVKHDNCTLSLNVVAVSEPAKLLLAGCVPDIEADGPSVCVEDERVYLHTQGCCRVKRADTRLTCSVAANLLDEFSSESRGTFNHFKWQKVAKMLKGGRFRKHTSKAY